MAALAAEKLPETDAVAPSSEPIEPAGGPNPPPTGQNAPAVEAAFEAVPPEMVAEIIDGQLHTMSRPGLRHGRAAIDLGSTLYSSFAKGIGGPGGWVIIIEPEIHLGPGPDKLVPDLAGWHLQRFPVISEDEDPVHIDVAPDWVCEILSPSTEVRDRIKKMRIYRREGVKHAWLIHPRNHTLEVYRLENGFWLQLGMFEGDQMVRVEPFEAIELDLKTLWGPRRPA